MFRRRLTWFWVILTGISLAIVARLTQIQVAQAAEYEQLAERLLTRRPEYVAAARGAILDRNGAVLLSDEPSWDVRVHYALLADPNNPRRDYLTEVARLLRSRGDYPADVTVGRIAEELRASVIPAMWERLAELAHTTPAELLRRAARIRARIERWRTARHQKLVREENQLLPLLEDVDNDVAVGIRLDLERHPWLRVVPGSRRVSHDADVLAHVLGRMGATSPELDAADPLASDELRGLRKEDRCGVSGVERLAETSLRGQRGRIRYGYDWQPSEEIAPVPGRDVYLTIDLDLQDYVVQLLGEAIENCRFPSGAAAVVIDVATREIRALASYPVYRYERFADDYEELRRDARRVPLLFRAVQAQYAPGSICKAITLVGGLSAGVVTPQTRFHCTGHLLPDKPDRFRCWIYNTHPGVTHDMTDNPDGQDAESAVRNSCNIYFFRVGERLGPVRLCEWFSRFGLGRTAGSGLIEETPAIVPTEAWLRKHVGRAPQTSDAWNFAIGQGEVTITPLQAANVAATIASGVWAPVRLAYDESGHAFADGVEPEATFDDPHVRVLRRGMWRVVNENGGTAHGAKLDVPGYELCGKTGSAQTQPRPIAYRYTFEWPDGHREAAVAYLEEDVLVRFGDPTLKRVGKHAVERYPALNEGEKLPAHAWFIGFTQPTTTRPGERPAGRVYAISVIIEFGEAGGRVAGPVAKSIAEYLVR